MAKAGKQGAWVDVAVKHLVTLMDIPSATMRVEDMADHVVAHAKKCGFKDVARDVDDTLRITVAGKDTKRVVGYGAHLDRIGLMVDELCDDGSVKISSIGGLYPGHVMEGNTASIMVKAKNGKVTMIEGVIAHVEKPIHKMPTLDAFTKREQKWEKIRLLPDACIAATKKNGKQMLKDLGVRVGQLVMLPTQLKVDYKARTLRSRWLDNMLGCAVLMTLMDRWSKEKTKPAYTIDLIFSVAEEAGMGGTAVIRPEMTDFVAVDTSCGEDGEDISNFMIKQKAGRLPYSARLVEELEMAAHAVGAGFEPRVMSGGGTDAEQARGAGFKGRIACVAVPIYGLHSIEQGTFAAVEGMLDTLHAHACGQMADAPKGKKK
ncbi:MAG: M20/M25/M40 family metallo-hydrolase [Alphaproteobacteria bacterium]